MKKHADCRFLGEPGAFHGQPEGSPYLYETYAQVGQKVELLIRGFQSLGLRPGDRIGVWALNRSDWAVTDYAIACGGYIGVPLYDTFGMCSSTIV